MRQVAGWLWIVVATASIAGIVATQSRPSGAGPLKSYHIKPGDLPPPTTGVANPPQVVPRPANATLTLPPGSFAAMTTLAAYCRDDTSHAGRRAMQAS